jgi:hypothetical protein
MLKCQPITAGITQSVQCLGCQLDSGETVFISRQGSSCISEVHAALYSICPKISSFVVRGAGKNTFFPIPTPE